MFTAWILLMLNSLFFTLRLSGGGSGSFPRPLKAEEERMYLERMAQGDLEARNILIEHNLRLVAHIMKKYYTPNGDQDDLISIGTIGLIKGISTFKPDKNVRLATYASRCIENEILMPSAQVAIQEAARIACQKPEEMMSSPNPAGWLRKTAGLVAKNMLREQARQKRTFLPLEVLLPESEPSEWDDSDRELVQLCLDVVSEEDFTLFRRVTLDGWTYVDAAKAAGISLWACYKRVERTQKKLRRAIEEHPERFF